jgi:adenylate kinase
MSSVSQYPAVLLFGAPGVGKGTQGRILQGIPGFVHISSGELFRSLDPESADGREAAETCGRGELVSDELTVRLFHENLEERVKSGAYSPESELLVLDGIPRTVDQANALKNLVAVHAIVAFDCSDEEAMVERILHRAELENRSDDTNVETIRHRFEVYHDETEPVLKCYSSEIIKKINPLKTPAEVLRELLDCVIPVHPTSTNNG